MSQFSRDFQSNRFPIIHSRIEFPLFSCRHRLLFEVFGPNECSCPVSYPKEHGVEKALRSSSRKPRKWAAKEVSCNSGIALSKQSFQRRKPLTEMKCSAPIRQWPSTGPALQQGRHLALWRAAGPAFRADGDVKRGGWPQRRHSSDANSASPPR